MVKTNQFYDLVHAARPSTGNTTFGPQRPAACRAVEAPPKNSVHKAANAGHCLFTATADGLDFYYAILALLAPATGSEDWFIGVLKTAGTHALGALEKLMNLREFEKSPPEHKCGLLVCLFYALVTFVRITHCRVSLFPTLITVMLIEPGQELACNGVFFQEYESLDLKKLQETTRLLGHYFLIVCERLGLPPDFWYTETGAPTSPQGFGYVTGICRYVSTFEKESDLRRIGDLLKELVKG